MKRGTGITEYKGQGIMILNMLFKEGLIRKITFEQTQDGNEKTSLVTIGGKAFWKR